MIGNGSRPNGTAPPISHAFELYELACHAKTEEARARLVLGANLLLMAVEQDLIDPALQIVVDQTPQRLTGAVEPASSPSSSNGSAASHPQLAYVVVLPVAFTATSGERPERRVVACLLTDQVLVLALPTETLRVGRRRPGPPPPVALLPPAAAGPRRGERREESRRSAAALVDVGRGHVESVDRTAGAGPRLGGRRTGGAGTSG